MGELNIKTMKHDKLLLEKSHGNNPAIDKNLYADREMQLEDMKIICLLYTSPSPRDSDSSRMPSSA